VENKYYLGFDIGTNSVGWAVTDENYKLRKYKSNLMWGVNLFDEAVSATERRQHRSERRRLNRRKQRISMLQKFFEGEILKIDENFFRRLKESSLLPEDSESRTCNTYFDDENFKDKDYFKEYPTIHHLICELMNSNEPHDIRLVYLACAYIVAHRGHFLFSVDKENVDEIMDFKKIYDKFYDALLQVDEDAAFDQDVNKSVFESILKKHISITAKEKQFKEKLFGGKIPKHNEDSMIRYDKLIKLVSGGNVKLSELFMNKEYEELENNSICVKNADFSDTLEILEGQLDDMEHYQLIVRVKAMYDWSLLVDILGDNENVMISESKKNIYEVHRNDLQDLKHLVRIYLSRDDYNKIFNDPSEKNNYVRYVKHSRLAGFKGDKFEKCKNQEEFCKFIKEFLEKMQPDADDAEIYGRLLKKCDENTLCPKQVTGNNRVIPYQLYYMELKKILENASAYLPFLNEKDEYGTVSDKILKIMEFRIPYYVGPLVDSSKSENAWLCRNAGKEEAVITPWNFNDIVDRDKTEKEFIRRMTCKCTYIAGEDVLPDNSLLYSKYKVLNEINTIRIDGKEISVSDKQKLYEALFVEKKQKVTKKKILQHFQSVGIADEQSVISGVDDTVKSKLQSYHDFKRLLENGVLTEFEVEEIIERITVSTDKKRLKNWLRNEYPKLSDKDLRYILTLKYKEYGRLSRRLLEDIIQLDEKTGEIISDKNIISMLWDTNENLMQLLSGKYIFLSRIQSVNNEFYLKSEKKKNIADRLKEMYIPSAVRRSVIRTLDIAGEVKKILKKEPDKIFIEMARGGDESKKGVRSEKRRDQITKFLNSIDCNTEKLKKELDSVDDDRLRSEKYFLYFTQLGRCMYTGKSIDISYLEDHNKWNIDHIWPQSRIKDDNLDNKVLVSSEANGKKDDKYPLNFVDSRWQEEMKSFWFNLRHKNLISEKKYNRLIRTTPFTDDELSGFIARQLVETRQSTKAVAQLLKEIYPNSKIVYVKAGLVSDFRNEMKMYKCREVNDLHHAKDAYLSIVVGNVFNTKFTENPLNFIRENKNYSIKLLKKDKDGKISGIMNHRVERDGNVAWDPQTSFGTVDKMMSKNSIRYVCYTYKRKSKEKSKGKSKGKGGLFDQNPVRKKHGFVSRKEGLSIEKYGGYIGRTVSFFSLIKVKADVIFLPVYLMNANEFLNDEDSAVKYAYKVLSEFYSKKRYEALKISDISFPLGKRIIKINTMLEVDGFRVNITARNEKCLSTSSAMPLIVDKIHNDYIKKIESFYRKYTKGILTEVTLISGITKAGNEELYDYLTAKCLEKPFCDWAKFKESGEILSKGRENFIMENITEQTVNLIKIFAILKTNRKGTCDLNFAGGVKKFHTERLNAILDSKKHKTIYIIDQSATGLYEKKSENLLELRAGEQI